MSNATRLAVLWLHSDLGAHLEPVRRALLVSYSLVESADVSSCRERSTTCQFLPPRSVFRSSISRSSCPIRSSTPADIHWFNGSSRGSFSLALCRVDPQLLDLGIIDSLDVEIPQAACVPHSVGVHTLLLFQSSRIREFRRKSETEENVKTVALTMARTLATVALHFQYCCHP